MKNKKALYENIMSSIAKEVKKILNESLNSEQQNKILLSYIQNADLEKCDKLSVLEDSWIEEQYAEEQGVDYFDYDEDFYTYCKDTFIYDLEKGLNSFVMDKDNKIYCERKLYIKNPNIESILENPLGIYWAWKKGNGQSINADEKGNVTLYGHIDPDNVDWAETVISNLIDPNETEITLKSGSSILIDKIKIGKESFNVNIKCII